MRRGPRWRQRAERSSGGWGGGSRTAKHAGVSVLRTVDNLEGDVEEALLRLQHLSRSELGLVVTVNASDSACDTVLEWLATSNPSEIRPAYLTEVLDVY